MIQCQEEIMETRDLLCSYSLKNSVVVSPVMKDSAITYGECLVNVCGCAEHGHVKNIIVSDSWAW